MSKKSVYLIHFAALLGLTLPSVARVAPIGTGFTYQGRLMDANQPADGLYNFRFKLFDGPTDGNQVGITVDVNNVDVIDGYFTMELDFVGDDTNEPQPLPLGEPEPQPLGLTYKKIWGNGEGRWLEIGVRPATKLLSAEPDPLPLAYTALGPRQRITPAPYALYALSSAEPDPLPLAPPTSGGIYDVLRWKSSWKLSSPLAEGDANGASIYNLGKLDIGPLVLPGAKLHVHGTTVVSEDGIETVFGNAGRPGYRFWGGEPTLLAGIGEHMGMFGAADNELAFSTSSNEWMRISSIGNVGIGTKTPSNKLDVESGGLGQIEVRGTDPTGFGGFDIFSDSPWFGWAGVGGTASPLADIRDNFFINVGGQTPTFQSTGDEPAPAASSGAGAGGIVFLTGGLTRAIIRNNGDVGIATTSPGAKLEVNGQVKITGGSPGAGKVLTSDAAGLANWQTPIPSAGDNLGNHIATQNIQLNGHYLSGDGGDEGVYVTNAGNVGIGTTTPTAKLHVAATTLVSVGGIETVFGTAGTPGYRFMGAGVNTGMFAPAANELAFSTNSADRMRINSAGNVGIGTNSPKQKLEVSQGSIILSEPNSTMRYILLQRNGSEVGSLSTANGRITVGAESGFDAMVQNSSAAGIIVKNSSGNVGIGMTDPSEKLDVIGTARLRGITAGSGTTVVVDTNGKLWKQSSSKRYKTNIHNIEDDADKVLELRPVRFQWKTTGQEEIGLIAEEVEGIAEDLVIYDQEGKADAVKYDKVSLYLLKVVKDLKSENESLKQRLETLEKKVGQMQPTIAEEVKQ
jgi:chaperonin cofactor prefoldin